MNLTEAPPVFITVEMVLNAVDEIIVEHGEDFVYRPRRFDGVSHGPLCSYADSSGLPSCLIGQILYRLDPHTFSEFRKRENRERMSYPVEPAYRLSGLLKRVSRAALEVMATGQRVQDNREPWGMARDEMQGRARALPPVWDHETGVTTA